MLRTFWTCGANEVEANDACVEERVDKSGILCRQTIAPIETLAAVKAALTSRQRIALPGASSTWVSETLTLFAVELPLQPG